MEIYTRRFNKNENKLKFPNCFRVPTFKIAVYIGLG